MAKRLQLLHKSGLTSRTSANEWINATLSTKDGLIAEPIVAIYTEGDAKHAILAIGTGDTGKYQIIDIDSVKSDLETAINAKLAEVTGSNAITVTDKNKIALKINTTDSKGNVIFEQDENGLKANVTFPDNIQDISKKLNIGEETDAAGVKSYYGLKKDIATAVSSVYKVKGTCTYAELASKDKTVGDVWNVTDAHNNVPAGTNYVYTSEGWDALGGTVDLSGYATADHTHTADAITGGTFNIARIPTGTTADTVALGNHNHDAAYAAKTHTHAISEVTNLQTTLDNKVDTTTLNTALAKKADSDTLKNYLPLDGGTMTENKGKIKFIGNNKTLLISTRDSDDNEYLDPYISFDEDAVFINANGIQIGNDGEGTPVKAYISIAKDSDLKLYTTEDESITLRELFAQITTLEDKVQNLSDDLAKLQKSAITTLDAGDSDITITGSGNSRTITLNSVTGGELE